MIFFSKKYTLDNSALLDSFTDWHCHLLPGVDDGVDTLEESLAILNEYERLGVKTVWLTPHIMEDIPNLPEELQSKFQELKSAYKGSIDLNLAAEHMLDNLFDKRLDEGKVLPIGKNKNHLLVETSYITPPFDLYHKLNAIKSAGYFPVLAHPERYVYMDDKDYKKVLGMEVKFQLNLYSLFGLYGPTARNKAMMLLKKGAYNLIGTDTHRLRQLNFTLQHKAVTKKTISAVGKISNLLD